MDTDNVGFTCQLVDQNNNQQFTYQIAARGAADAAQAAWQQWRQAAAHPHRNVVINVTEIVVAPNWTFEIGPDDFVRWPH